MNNPHNLIKYYLILFVSIYLITNVSAVFPCSVVCNSANIPILNQVWDSRLHGQNCDCSTNNPINQWQVEISCFDLNGRNCWNNLQSQACTTGCSYLNCIPNWINRQEGLCQTNDQRLVSYTDSNSCNKNENLPLDAGLYSCNYCSQDIKGPYYGDWTSCFMNDKKNRTNFYLDLNYDSCCAITSLSSDCEINTIQYKNSIEETSCDFCIPNITQTNETCTSSDTLISHNIDVNNCYEKTGLDSDKVTSNQTLTCDYPRSLNVCQTYDNFASISLDTSKWETKQDVENQPFMEEYWVDSDSGNFHTLQNTTGDKRVYLFPKYNFTTGDVFEYDADLISKENHYMQMVLLTGDQYMRIGIFGYISGVQGYDELGKSHIKIEFQENHFHLERTSPSNITFIDNLSLTNANGNYSLYIGSVFTNTGHIDYDNFKICNQVQITGMDFMDLTNISNLTNITNFYIENKNAKIAWKDSLDLSEEINWFDYINISNNRVEIDSSIASALNRSARITLNNVAWTTPRILKNGVVCGASEGCTAISYNDGEFVFDVTGFSTYETEETPIVPSSSSSSSSGGGTGGGGGAPSKKVTNITNNTLNQNITNQSMEVNDLNNETINAEENNETSEELTIAPKGLFSITGAVIGNLTSSTKRIGIIIAVIIILSIIVILLRHRFRKK